MTDLQTLPFHVQLLVREYGHSTFQLILGLRDIADPAERSRRAAGIVQLMLRLQPALREQVNVQDRLWNHLNAMLGGDVALDAPVPLRPTTLRIERPTPIPYPRRGPKFRAYGAAVEALVAKAMELSESTEREQATALIGRTMKFLYRQHNKENAKDATILRHLGELSNGELRLDPAVVDRDNLFEMPGDSKATFIVPQPGQGGGQNNGPRDRERRGEDRRDRRDDGGPRNGGGNGGGFGTGNGGGFGNGNGGGKSGKKRKKNRSQEPQQPPQ